jgi:hypothetical protein
MSDEHSIHSLIAFAIVELNVSVGLDFYQNLSFQDPLYTALMAAWESKQKRLDSRAALICAVMANCHGDGKKKYEVADFMPKKQSGGLDEEAIRNNFIAYNARYLAQQAAKGR